MMLILILRLHFASISLGSLAILGVKEKNKCLRGVSRWLICLIWFPVMYILQCWLVKITCLFQHASLRPTCWLISRHAYYSTVYDPSEKVSFRTSATFIRDSESVFITCMCVYMWINGRGKPALRTYEHSLMARVHGRRRSPAAQSPIQTWQHLGALICLLQTASAQRLREREGEGWYIWYRLRNAIHISAYCGVTLLESCVCVCVVLCLLRRL